MSITGTVPANEKRRYKTAAFRLLSEPLRGHKAKAFSYSMRANCVQAQPGSAGGDSLAIPETVGVCNRFYPLLRLLVCADPGHAQNTQKSGGSKPPLFVCIRTTPRAQIPGIISHCARETASRLSLVSPVRPCRFRRPSSRSSSGSWQ